MIGSISKEIQVNVPSIKAWELYSSQALAKITEEKLKNVIEKLKTEGDGGVGTIVEIVFTPGGAQGFRSYKEKFTKIDHEKRVKETEVIEGGYLDLGFNLFRVRFEIIDKEEGTSCITRSTIEYDVKEEFEDNASFVNIEPLVMLMQAAADILLIAKANGHN
ncbi:norbelladine synthase-like [Impatiens glandulifera]|uniref:norbelladine synthase-like n=1 Tax=Impatiens glandulifera TaxID=253017 RepID=UPI001FB06D69|nr:norbelladine synthase-like [Impatiens glandulifera]